MIPIEYDSRSFDCSEFCFVSFIVLPYFLRWIIEFCLGIYELMYSRTHSEVLWHSIICVFFFYTSCVRVCLAFQHWTMHSHLFCVILVNLAFCILLNCIGIIESFIFLVRNVFITMPPRWREMVNNFFYFLL